MSEKVKRNNIVFKLLHLLISDNLLRISSNLPHFLLFGQRLVNWSSNNFRVIIDCLPFTKLVNVLQMLMESSAIFSQVTLSLLAPRNHKTPLRLVLVSFNSPLNFLCYGNSMSWLHLEKANTERETTMRIQKQKRTEKKETRRRARQNIKKNVFLVNFACRTDTRTEMAVNLYRESRWSSCEGENGTCQSMMSFSGWTRLTWVSRVCRGNWQLKTC